MAHADNGPQGDAMAMEAFAVVRALAVELQPRLRKTLVVREDSDLDRELGLDSLGRAELLLRLGRTFGVRLPETLLGEARTVGDLLAALRVARPGAAAYVPAGERAPEAASLPPVPEPVRAGTLIEVLAEHAAARGGRVHLRLWRRPDQEEAISYGDLDRAARAVAAGLMLRDVRPDERVGLMLPTGPGFFAAFFGVLYAGAIPVPIYPPFRPSQIEDHLRRQSGILRNAEASLLVTDAATGAVGRLLHGMVASLRGVASAADLAAAPPLAAPLPAMPATTALIQYTSGSTGDPKGVVLTHANLLANIRSMGQALEASSTDVVASWLPLYHDMGLIGCWLGSLYFGAQAAIMPPLAFLADPARWLWAIHRHRATISAAPNFAYELCLKSVRDVDIEGLDLGSLRRLANGAEPVSPATLARFAQRFGRYGLRPNALAPVYGLAESVVALAFPPPGRGPVIDRIDRDALSTRGLAVPAPPGAADALDLVACGQPIPGHEIRIVDEGGRELPERREGRLQFKGPSATAGYFRAPEKTRALFDGEWLESGDRAYIAGGDVYITGRIKDIIIRAGRHIYPQELEELVGAVEGVRRGCVAAISGADPASGTERLVVVAETRLRDPAARDDLRRRIVEASRAILPDMPPEEVVLVPPHAIPKTSSGKLRRAATREAYLDGTLGRAVRPPTLQMLRLLAESAHLTVRRRVDSALHLAFGIYAWCLLLPTGALAIGLTLLLRNPAHIWRVNHRAARLFWRLLRMPAAVTDAERAGLDSPHPHIVAVNHASYADSLLIAALLAQPHRFVAKAELARMPVLRRYLRKLGTLFVERFVPGQGVADIGRVREALRRGDSAIVFPEGTFTSQTGLGEFHLGAFQAAAAEHVPIIPLALKGTRSVLRDGRWLPRRGPVEAVFGAPLLPRADEDRFAAAVRLRDETRAFILQHCGEPSSTV